MKQIRRASLAVVFITLSYFVHGQIAKGEGGVKVVTRELSKYNEIIAQGNFNLIITQGEKEGIRIEADSNLIELFQTSIHENVLSISMVAVIKKAEALNVYVSIKELNNIILLNEVTLKSVTVIHFNSLKIFAGGLSKITMELFASKLDIQLTDGTYAILKGYSEYFNLELHDETEVNAFEMQVDYASVLASGLTEVMLDVQKDLKLIATGASNIYYTGNPVVSKRVFASSGFIVKRQKSNS